MALRGGNGSMELEEATGHSSHSIHIAPEGDNSTNQDDKKANQQAVSPETSQKHSDHPLSPEEAAIIQRQVIIPEIKTGLASLYRYASRGDLLIIFVSCLMAIGSGAAMPLMTVLFGNLQGTLQGYFQGNSTGGFQHELNKVVLYFVYLAVGNFVATYFYTVGFIYTGEHIASKIREKYLEHCLRQNIAYFDQVGAGEITTRITADTNLVQEAISQKVGLTLAGATTFFAAFIIGFIEYWKLTLILSSALFAILLSMGLGSKYIVKYSKLTINAYSPGGSLAEEVIGSIRNTVAFGAQSQLKNKYDVYLGNAERYGFRSKIATALLVASMISISNFGYALAFWVGGQYVVYEGLAFEKVLVTVMAVLMGAFSLGNVGSHASAIFTGVAAVNKIYRTIDRQSPLDPRSESGDMPEEIEGLIKIENIKHIYPSRPGTVVMDNMSLEIPAGKKTALVGASGCGKSTIIGLIERFYEPVSGKIFIDGHDISTLNLRWLRQQIALVSQEPVLFGTTIHENIKYGMIGTTFESEDEATQRQCVIEAAKKANAHDFISSLPDGYETDVGTRGFLLSGGQKQRIAIARAIVSNPKILLLDEATSALDTKSEGVVQAALDAASKGRTTITVAHRLSTIRNYDNIVVMSNGKIVEQGTHDQLVQNQGPYYDLVATQNIEHQEDDRIRNEKNWNTPKEDNSTHTQVASEEGSLAQAHDAPASRLNHATTADPETNVSLSQGTNEDKKYSFWNLAKLVLSFNRGEKAILVVGLIFAIISGGCTPVQAVLLAKAISNLSTPLEPSNLHHVKKESDFWAAMYVMLGGVLAISYCVHGVAFAKSSERLLRHARSRVFGAILRQDVCFFDEKENTPGALTAFLSTKTTDLVGLGGSSLGNILTSCTTLIAGLVVGITIGWKLGLVSASAVPVLIICGYLRVWILAYFQSYSKEAYASSASFASEAVSNIHTVASLTREKEILQHYRKSLSNQQKSGLYSTLKSSILFAFSESFILLILALCFWYGGTLIVKGEYSMFQFFVCFASVIFSAQATGAIFSDAASMSKAYLAGQEIKSLLDRKPNIETHAQGGASLAHDGNGHVEFRGVHFHYPTRPNQPVLSGIDIDIHPGQFVAFVGSSGCGKSTSISLLERFYDPTKGGIFIDGTNIKDYNTNAYRKMISLVSQEPTLYQGTIKENILIGASDAFISDKDIKTACCDANIYEFIISLADGFDTVVGNRGMLLSGGQKQRIAIARALIRNPKILLLDEATSALDSESEHVVQAALDKAAKGRTTIAVAHRLSTIQKADKIFVFGKGQIVEQGTHAELISQGAAYAELVKLQSLEENDHES